MSRFARLEERLEGVEKNLTTLLEAMSNLTDSVRVLAATRNEVVPVPDDGRVSAVEKDIEALHNLVVEVSEQAGSTDKAFVRFVSKLSGATQAEELWGRST